MGDAIYILAVGLVFIFFVRYMRTNIALLDRSISFVFKFVLLFFFFTGDITLTDWVNDETIVVIPSMYAYVIGILWSSVLIMDVVYLITKREV